MGRLVVGLYVKATLWAKSTAERCREKDEADRSARIVSVLLGWFLLSYALQAIVAVVMTLLVKQGSLPEDWREPLSSLLSVVASCLSYPIVVWGVPGLKGRLFAGDSWIHAPRWGETARKMSAGKLGGWASTLLVGVAGAVACFVVVQASSGLVGAALGGVSIASSSVAGIIKSTTSGSLIAAVAGVLSLLFTLVAAPVLEEATFRGIVARDAVDSVFASKPDGKPSRTRQVVACVVASFLFGLLHIASLGGWRQSVVTVVAMTAMGTVLALEARAAKSIWPGVVSHVLYNLVTLTLLLVLG